MIFKHYYKRQKKLTLFSIGISTLLKLLLKILLKRSMYNKKDYHLIEFIIESALS